MCNIVNASQDSQDDRGSQTASLEEMVLNLSWTFSGVLEQGKAEGRRWEAGTPMGNYKTPPWLVGGVMEEP